MRYSIIYAYSLLHYCTVDTKILFIVAYFIFLGFKEILVSTPWRLWDNSDKIYRSYVKDCSINHKIVRLFVLRQLFTAVWYFPQIIKIIE